MHWVPARPPLSVLAALAIASLTLPSPSASQVLVVETDGAESLSEQDRLRFESCRLGIEVGLLEHVADLATVSARIREIRPLTPLTFELTQGERVNVTSCDATSEDELFTCCRAAVVSFATTPEIAPSERAEDVEMATLVLRTSGPVMDVLLNGLPVGSVWRHAHLTIREVAAGDHRLLVVDPLRGAELVEVYVEPGETRDIDLSVAVGYDPNPGPWWDSLVELSPWTGTILCNIAVDPGGCELGIAAALQLELLPSDPAEASAWVMRAIDWTNDNVEGDDYLDILVARLQTMHGIDELGGDAMRGPLAR